MTKAGVLVVFIITTIVLAAADGCTAALAAAHYVESRKAAEGVCELPQAMRTAPG